MKNEFNLPLIGSKYKVISGPYKGFIGKCVSYDYEQSLAVILQDDNWNTKAVKMSEVDLIDNADADISQLQKN